MSYISSRLDQLVAVGLSRENAFRQAIKDHNNMNEQTKGKEEIPESRYVSLETAINQLRNARKNLMAVGFDEDFEEQLIYKLGAVLNELRDYRDTVVPVKGTRGRPAKDTTEGNDSERSDSEGAIQQETLEEELERRVGAENV